MYTCVQQHLQQYDTFRQQYVQQVESTTRTAPRNFTSIHADYTDSASKFLAKTTCTLRHRSGGTISFGLEH